MNNSAISEPSAIDLSWRTQPLPSPDTLSSVERIGWVDRYRMTKQAGHQLTVDEMRHMLSCLAAARVEVARRKAADNKAAKGANLPAPSLDDL